ncbi:hypothetical protein M514_00978 [Trichuris suis]|uniref:Uncharacterized protein n=1 Tax=Trichuris suis TaxID=68888 RepID=A0A085NLY3_9BILA|nr:hypothetical protein M514_00978 [Trichuris suis]
MKPLKLKDHFKRCYADNSSKDVSYFRAVRESIMQKRTLKSMISSLSKPNADGLLAFYRISLLIAKGGMPHAIGKELMIPAIAERYKLCLKNAQKQLRADDQNLIKTVRYHWVHVEAAFLQAELRKARGVTVSKSRRSDKKEGWASEADVELCCEHLRALRDDFSRRFQEILSIVIPDCDQPIYESRGRGNLDARRAAEIGIQRVAKAQAGRVTSGSGCKNKCQSCTLLSGPW